jgi:hypothetical protein
VEPKNPVLERFERAVDLPLYLGYRGFRLAGDDHDPSRLTMVNPRSGDSLVVRKDLETGSWSYVNPRNPDDRGSLTDYLSTRDRLGPPACLERIVALGNPLVRDAEGHGYRQYLQHAPPELQKAVSDHVRVMEAETSALRTLDKLGVARGTLDEWRFGKVRSHDDLAKVVSDPTDLWASKFRPTDKKIVLTEQPIDAMGYEKSRGKQMSCYLATGGTLSDARKKRLAHLLCEVPPGVKIVLAFGRDEAGRRLADEIQALAPTVKMEREMPAFGSRWSNQMQIEQRHARSMQRVGPSLAH